MERKSKPYTLEILTPRSISCVVRLQIRHALLIAMHPSIAIHSLPKESDAVRMHAVAIFLLFSSLSLSLSQLFIVHVCSYVFKTILL